MMTRKILTVVLFLMMLGIIIDQHIRLMQAFEQTDRALKIANEWRDIALGSR